MDVKIFPHKLDGEIEAPSSKSMAQRIFIAAFLSDTPTEIYLKNLSEDISATIDCLKTLGAEIIDDGAKYTIIPPLKIVDGVTLNARESGATLRFLLPVVMAVGGEFSFFGEGRLPKRPIGELLSCLKNCSYDSDGLPFSICGKLVAGEYRISGGVSSQYISGLLFALPLLKGESRIVLTDPLQSESYVNMTIEVLKKFGVIIEKTEYGYRVLGEQKYVSPKEITVEGDFSSASFFLGGNILGNRVRVTNLDYNSVQGDRRIKELLLSFNAKGTVLDVKDCPDLVPILAVCACFSCSETKIINAKRLRLKESDRISAIVTNINKLGGIAKETEDGIIIKGSLGLKGGAVVDGYKDHRIVMAMAIAGTVAEQPITVLSCECVNKSYPAFFNDFIKLGGECNVL